MNRLDMLLAAICLCLSTLAQASSLDAEREVRFKALTSELRCLVCQNQTIADSNAALAVDLRNEVQRMLNAGATDVAIVDYMVARYGDFVLYRPPVKPTTLLLWTAPALFMIAGLVGWAWLIRSGRRGAISELTEEERARAAALLGERTQLRLEERQS